MPGPPSMVDTPPVASPVPPAQLYPTQSCAWPAYLVGFLLANYIDFNCLADPAGCGWILASLLSRCGLEFVLFK